MTTNLVENAKKLKIEGHRGGQFEFDNTISAFNLAVENGLEQIEFDVWLTSDKIPIVLHGGLNGEVEYDIPEFKISKDDHINTISLEQISSIVLPNGESVPTLEEVIDNFSGKIGLNCEVKDDQEDVAQIILDILIEKDVREGFFLSSFNEKQLQNFSKWLSLSIEYDAPIRFGAWYEFINEIKAKDWCIPSDVITFDSIFTSSELVNSIHKAGKEAWIYFYPTSNENIEAYQKAVEAGVDSILSDNPAELRQFLDNIILANHN